MTRPAGWECRALHGQEDVESGYLLTVGVGGLVSGGTCAEEGRVVGVGGKAA